MGSAQVGDEAAIRAVEVRKVYGASGTRVEALRGVSLAIAPGERVALLGRSGSGKSTLLNLLGGLDQPSSGGLRVGGSDLDQLDNRAMARFRSATVGIVFQSFHLIGSRSAVANVELPMIFAGRSPRDRRAAARRALEAVGLGERLDHRPSQLSGGEAQRVAVARALANQPRIILADEPTGNLDSGTGRQVMALILDYVRQAAATLVLVTHDEELAAACTDRVVRLADGRVTDEP